MLKKIPIGDLVLDMTIYPRHSVDGYHVNRLRDAIRAGEEIPPILVEKDSNIIIDGAHRFRAWQAEKGDAWEILCEVKAFKNQLERLAAAVQPNCRHGETMDTHDKLRAVKLLQEAGATTEVIAKIMAVEEVKIVGWIENRYTRVNGRDVPTKLSTEHFGGGARMTTKQEQIQRKLTGMRPLAWVNMLLDMLENDMIDKQNENLLAGLRKLAEKIDSFLAAV